MNGEVRPQRSRRERQDPTANDRLKDRWGDRMAWSVIAAVLLHAGAFVLWPEWTLVDRPEVPGLRPSAMEWVASSGLASRGSAGGAAAALPVRSRPDSASEADEGEDRTASEGGSGSAAGNGRGGPASGSGAPRDRLLGAEAPTATLAEPATSAEAVPTPEPAVRESVEAGGSSGPIGGRAATAEVARTERGDSLDLGRLDALRPEVTAGLLSSSVLLRNPNEVAGFMRRASRRRPAVARSGAWLTVAIYIDESGSVDWAEVSQSSGREALDEVALTLFEEVAAFEPAVEEGQRVPKSMLFHIQFPW